MTVIFFFWLLFCFCFTVLIKLSENFKYLCDLYHGSCYISLMKKLESSRKTSISAFLTMPKNLTVWITTNWKILKEMGIPDHLTCLLRNLFAVKKQQLKPDIDNRLVPNQERSTSWLHIVTLLI